MARRPGRDRVRLRIAQETAKILAEEGLHEYPLAKQKAVARLGLTGTVPLPSDEEIELALQEFHRLFRAETQPRHILRLRKIAVEAMQFLHRFNPRLTGGVLDGTAGDHSPITIALSHEPAEDVIQMMVEAGIPFEESTASVSASADQSVSVPGLTFIVDRARVEILIVPPVQLKALSRQRREKGAIYQKGDFESVRTLIKETEGKRRDKEVR